MREMNLTKAKVARRQLGTALALFLEDRDPVSVHMLACAGGELADHLAHAKGATPFSGHALAVVPNSVTGARQVAPDATKRLWADGRFRLFLSHKAQVKRETAELKQNLLDYGVSAFVAHEDIHPTKEWQDEIENALATMDGFVALMTADFHDSNWTDQEVGYALARGVPIIAVRLEQNPYGFLGKFQALNSDWKSAPEGIVKLLIKNDRMLSAFISALSNCPFFDAGNTLANILQSIETVSEKQIDEIIEAVNTNVELQGSYGFNGTKPTIYGKGLVPHLHRWGPRRYVMSKTRPGKIEPFAP